MPLDSPIISDGDDDYNDDSHLDTFVTILSLALLRRLVLNDLQFTKTAKNLLILGVSGAGKSATGNTVLGRTVFDCRALSTSVTTEVQCAQFMYEDEQINIIDTPGGADTNYINSYDKLADVKKIINNMNAVMKKCFTGIHAFVFVVRLGDRFKAEGASVVNNLKQIFGQTFLSDHGIILFTHGDHFLDTMESEGTPSKTFDTWCREQIGYLGKMIWACNYRCVLFNNREKDEQFNKQQLGHLMSLVKNLGEPYSGAHYELCQRSRDTLYVRLKKPELIKKFSQDIQTMRSKVERSRDKISEKDFLNLKADLLACQKLIELKDRNTGVLVNLISDVIFLLQEIDEIKEKQKGCHIL